MTSSLPTWWTSRRCRFFDDDGSRGDITARRFSAAIDDLEDLSLTRFPVLPLMRRAYELRANVTAYDAAYVALAEQLDCTLVTADARLASAPGVRCRVELVTV